jgi:hypothetical protein
MIAAASDVSVSAQHRAAQAELRLSSAWRLSRSRPASAAAFNAMAMAASVQFSDAVNFMTVQSAQPSDGIHLAGFPLPTRTVLQQLTPAYIHYTSESVSS